jgi:hypothetical protein
MMAVALGALFPACGASVRTVPSGPHAATATPPVVVAEPPPVNKVETVSADPGKPCAWLDGRWEWSDQGWQWFPGMWVIPPKACHFAPPETVWVPSAGRGLLFYLAGRWYPDSGPACEVSLPCSNASP